MQSYLSVVCILTAWIVASSAAQAQYSCNPGSIDGCTGDSFTSFGHGSDCAGFAVSDSARWSATVDALFMNRVDSSSAVLGFNTVNAAQTLNADALDFGFQPGFEVALRRETCDGDAFELRYFGINDWDAGLTTATTPGDLLQINTAVPTFVTAGTALTAQQASSLHNAEFNYSRRLNEQLDLLAGFRYLELDEVGRLGLIGAGVPADLASHTSNRLYGFQAGGDLNLLSSGDFSLDLLGKAGVYGNHSSHNGRITTGGGTLLSSDDSTLVSFVGELNLSGSYSVSESVSLHCGYRLMAVDNVATAADQLSATNFVSGAGINNSDSVFYHGLHAGLTFSY